MDHIGLSRYEAQLRTALCRTRICLVFLQPVPQKHVHTSACRLVQAEFPATFSRAPLELLDQIYGALQARRLW